MPQTFDTKPFLFIKGPLIFNLESCFFHWQRYPRRRVTPQTPPLHETARPRELEQPYRHGHGHAFRIPLTRRAVVLGYWEPAGEAILEDEESDRLMEAVEGAMIPGVTATEISSWARGRKPWWIRLLDWLQARWEAVASSEVAQDLGFSMADAKARGYVSRIVFDSGEYADVIPWDGKVYDLEDARVELPPKNAS